MPSPLLLVVDDSPAITHVVRLLARRSGQELICCADAEQTLQALRAAPRKPDLLLLDLNLPGLDGLTLYRQLRADGALLEGVAVALFTQWAQPTLVAQALEAGIDFAISKDCLASPADWKARVDEILAQASRPAAEHATCQEDVLLLARCLRQALAHPTLRQLGEEVVRVIWNRGLARAGLAGSAGVDAVDVGTSSAKLSTGLAPLVASRPDRVALLVQWLAYQVEGLLGGAASEPIRTTLASVLRTA